MKKIIRDYAPFIMLLYSFIFAILSYFEFYYAWFKYLPDAVGYSIFTNIFMLTVYMNKKYCHATKIAVLGLISLNVLNLMYVTFNINGVLYDIYLILIITLILIVKRLNNDYNTDRASKRTVIN